ncbi:hypothetical protein BCR39DRAFT_507851 [Naematelia encephala]|uniref:Beta-glucuronidase C-terminal domain-containing protein n=1 Tax=Naematelia encephala TaxID=71784 RepID=A0A1Y2ALK2_9TREE|nr:hypothetical protein BCR39DRAFT_507851 [Naematelia encephala]
MRRSPPTKFFLAAFSLILPSVLGVTVYSVPTETTTATPTTSLAAGATWTGLAAYDPTRLTPPAAPSPPVTSAAITPPADGPSVWDSGYQLSIKQSGNFFGFSLELSVASSVLGKNSNSSSSSDQAGNIKPQLLNYLNNLRDRAKIGPYMRVGGNSQETSSLFAGGFGPNVTDNLQKVTDSSGSAIEYTLDLFYAMANITNLVGTQWMFGLSFNESEVENPTGNPPLAAHYAQQILGPHLIGFGLANEPDLYVDHNERPSGWTLTNYLDEFYNTTSDIITQGGLTNPEIFLGPSVCCSEVGFDMSDILGAGWLTTNLEKLSAVTVQRYLTNNCGIGGYISAQDIFYQFLNHTGPSYLTGLYTDATATVVAAGKEMIMLEMNTASCSGFPGLSDSFGAAMWLADWALAMAYGNFSAAMMHIGGTNAYYNPFTAPPWNATDPDLWVTGSPYFSTLLLAEALGSSNVSQVVDISGQTDIYHPVYAIYENDVLTRMVLFNYVSDTTGASTWSPTITTTASSVYVRYLTAVDVAEQYNITWAGQNMGPAYESDGRLYGDVETSTIQCTNGQCTVPVAAPQIALVFFSDQALQDSSVDTNATTTFTSTATSTSGTQTSVNPSVVQTSNGQNGPVDTSGSNSKGSANGAQPQRQRAPMIGIGAGTIIIGVLLAMIM